MIAYRAMLDVPRELVREVAKLLRAERRARGTRTGSRALTCWDEALLVLAWFRNQGDISLVGAGFRVSRATAYRHWAFARAWLHDAITGGKHENLPDAPPGSA